MISDGVLRHLTRLAIKPDIQIFATSSSIIPSYIKPSTELSNRRTMALQKKLPFIYIYTFVMSALSDAKFLAVSVSKRYQRYSIVIHCNETIILNRRVAMLIVSLVVPNHLVARLGESRGH